MRKLRQAPLGAFKLGLLARDVCPGTHRVAHYGAIIEALRTAYVKSNPELRGGKIIADQGAWGKIAFSLNAALDAASLDQDAWRILRNKISNLNNLPAGPLMEFARKLGSRLANRESCLGSPQPCGHGSRISSAEYVQVVRGIKLLNIIFNRMLIAMTDANDSYIDYYSLRHPTRKISEPVSS